jgi:hypothetical protein
LKHETAWQVQRLPNGDTKWTSPSGRSYTKPAANYPVDRTTEADPVDRATETDPVDRTTELDQPTCEADPDPPPPF